MTKCSLRIVFLCLFLPALAMGQSIPRDRLVKWDPGVRGGVPNVATVTDVMQHGAKGDGITDDTQAFRRAIASVKGEGAVLVPRGTYLLRGNLALKSGIVLRGEGAQRSHLVFDFPTKKHVGAIRMTGWDEHVEMPIIDGYSAGSKRLTFDKDYALSPTGHLRIYSSNDAGVMYTKPEWQQSWAENSRGQLVQISAAKGKYVEIDTPLRLDHKPELEPRAMLLVPIIRSGIEKLHVKRLDSSDDSIIFIADAVNCWVIDSELENCSRAHIWARRGRWLTIEGNYMHHAHDYGGGGHGYGVALSEHSSDCLVTDNIFISLRHSLLLQKGANGNVLSYNYSRENKLCDISIHGHYSYMNLFEGNVVQDIQVADFWGPTGPLTTLFRNRVESGGITVRDHSHRTNIIGNSILRGELTIEDNVEDSLAEGNSYSGNTHWHSLRAGTVFPPSLYRNTAPDFWDNRAWPCTGAQADKRVIQEIPAQTRHKLQMIGKATGR